MFLSKIALKNPVLITMLTLALILFGTISLNKLGVDMFPAVDIPFVTVTAIYPGADSHTMEQDVVKKIEDSIGTLSGIKHIQSRAMENVALLVVEFRDGVNVDQAAQDVRNKISAITRDLPDDIDSVLVDKLDLNALPVLSLVLQAPAGENASKINNVAENIIKSRLQTIKGVGSVQSYGTRNDEIAVLLNPLRIGELQIPTISFFQLLGSSSIKIPAGTIRSTDGKTETTVKGDAQVNNIEQLRRLTLLSVHGMPLKVEDIATVSKGLEEETSTAMLNLETAVAFKVLKQSGVNVVQMAHAVKASVKELKKSLPSGYTLRVVSDTTPFTEIAVGSTNRDIFFGALLALFTIFIFLMNKRAIAIIAVSLPASIVGTFLFVYAMGFTLNFLTTLALSLSVGILTDDAIVVIENIFRHLEMGESKREAVINATKEVGLAVVTAELALISVFGPTIYMKGIIGSFFKQFGMTVVAAIVISMIVSFTVTPLLSFKFLKIEPRRFFFFTFMDKLLKRLENGYAAAVSVVLKHRFLTLVLGVAIFVSSLFFASHLKQYFVPPVDRGEFEITAELPADSSLQTGKEVAEQMVRDLETMAWRKFFFTTIGGGQTNAKNIITMKVQMVDFAKRSLSQEEAMQEVRTALKSLVKQYDIALSVTKISDIGKKQSPIQAHVLGTSLQNVRSDAAALVTYMKNQGGFADITSSDRGNKKEIVVHFNHSKMNELGVNAAESALVLRFLITGKKIAKFDDENGDKIDVVAKLGDSFKRLKYLSSIMLKSSSGKPVRLSDVATISYDSITSEVSRFDRSLSVTINASLAPGHDLGSQVAAIRKWEGSNMNEGGRIAFSGDAEMMKESFLSLLQTLMIAMLLIYIVLAGQFNSFIHPFTIMTALPFAVSGALITLFLADEGLSIMSFIGMIMLMGIVTKNSILLIDFALQEIRKGAKVVDALVESSRVRLRPILMTAGGTIMGMVPVITSTAQGAEVKHSMGWAVFGGLIFSTLITLFIVPVVFSLFDGMTRKKN